MRVRTAAREGPARPFRAAMRTLDNRRTDRKQFSTNFMVCPECGLTVEGEAGKEAVEDWGRCLGCDHARLDLDGPENEEGMDVNK